MSRTCPGLSQLSCGRRKNLHCICIVSLHCCQLLPCGIPLGRSYTTTNDYYDAPYHHISSSTQQNAKHQTSSNYVASRTNINETSIKNKSLFIKTNTTIQDNTMRDLLIGFAMNYDVSAIYRTVHAFHEHVPLGLNSKLRCLSMSTFPSQLKSNLLIVSLVLLY